MSESSATPERQIARAAGVVMAGFVLSNITGLINRMLYSRAYGTGLEIDAFLAANRLPQILFYLIAGGALASAFVPTFTDHLARDDRRGAWKLASSIANLVGLVLILASILASLVAPWLVRQVLAPGFDDPGQIALTVSLLRILLLAPTIFGLSGLLMGILNAHQHFLLPALAPTFHWLGWIIGTLVLRPLMGGIQGLAWGVVLGAVLHLLVQLPGLARRGARYVPTLGLSEPSVRQVGRLMAPRLLGVAVVQLNFLVNTILASTMETGSLTAIEHAFAIMTMPQVVIAQAIAIAALPTFSAQVARGELSAMRRSLAGTLRGVVFLSLPAALGMILLRGPVVALLLQGGAFDAGSTDQVAWALLWYSAGLLGHAVLEIVVRAFYALKDTRTPVFIGAAMMALNIGLSLLFASLFRAWGWQPHGGLALANSLATALESMALLVILHRRLQGLGIGHAVRAWLGIILASVVMAAVVWGWIRATASQPVAVVALGGVGLGLAAYVLVAGLLRVPEVRALPRALLASRRRSGRPEVNDQR